MTLHFHISQHSANESMQRIMSNGSMQEQAKRNEKSLKDFVENDKCLCFLLTMRKSFIP